MSIIPLQGVWWKKVDPSEKLWLSIAFIWCLILFAMMPLWHAKGGQNPSMETYRITPEMYSAKVDAFISANKVGEEKGIPVVAAKADQENYLLARMWMWYPVLKMKKGETYRLHLSSVDLQHGLSVFPLNINFMVLPGYDYVLTVTPTTSGQFTVVCNEFCGIDHHRMVGKIIVE
jgi:cytochrome c oxidase subunit 2